MTMKKFALRGLIVLAVAVALCIFFSGTLRTLTTPKARFAQAKMGKFEQSTSLTGKVVFPEEAEIRLPVPEGVTLTVTRVRVAAGDRVKQGDPLIQARVTDVDKTLETLRKDYETARNSLRTLEKKTGEIRLSPGEQKWQEAWEAEKTAMEAERDARVNRQVLLQQAGLEAGADALPADAGEELTAADQAWRDAEAAWQRAQAQLKALDRYAITETTWTSLQQKKEYTEKMAACEEQMTALQVLKKEAEQISAPYDGYVSQVLVEKGASVDGDTVLLMMTAEGTAPVIRADLGSMKQDIGKGSTMTVETDSWGRPETKVLSTGVSQEGHAYADCEINEDVRYALGSVATMMKNEIKMTLYTRAKESTCLLPASAVRGSGSDRYVYVAERKSSTFGGSGMICRKMPVTVLGESGSTVSLAEDLTYSQVLYMEDRALSEGAAVMTYDGN